jgi:hypothetical protein
MCRSIPVRLSLSAVLLAVNLATWAGCGGPPATGTMGTPVNPTEAAQQNKAMEAYYKSQPKKVVPYRREHP